ncbi:MAG: ATP-binding protein [Nitrososphaerota archaeon]|nr:ATP-binding protein [Nitrososphaerota archaeon]
MDIDLAVGRYRGATAPRGAVKRDAAVEDGSFMSAIIGPRRAGKTTFMLQLMDGLPLPASNKVFVNGEDVAFEGMTADDLPKIEEAVFRLYRPDPTKDLRLFIDEVQRFPSWARWVRTLHDSGKYGVMVTGSTSELSTDRLPSVLRGRALNTLVLPFSFAELLRAKGAEAEGLTSPEKAGALASFADEYVEFGGYPAVVLAEGAQLKHRILQELFDTVVQRDMIERLKVRSLPLLRAFVSAVLGSACRPLSARSISRWLGAEGLKLGRQTALSYLDGAEDVFMIKRAYPFSKKPKERRVSPKVYALDSGFLALVGGDSSKKLENQVFVDLVRRGGALSYWRSQTTGKEVDFVVGGRRPELVQAAWSVADPATYDREVGALKEAAGELGAERLTVVTSKEEKVFREGGREVEVVPAWKWFLRPGAPREGAKA